MTLSVGVWEPGKAVTVDLQLLQRFLDVMAEEEPLSNDDDSFDLSGRLTSEEVSKYKAVMKLPAETWTVAEPLSDEQVEALTRFFTLAEVQFAGWDSGRQSPVIALVRILKKRGSFTRELRRWIKSHTDNRYLPYGSAL